MLGIQPNSRCRWLKFGRHPNGTTRQYNIRNRNTATGRCCCCGLVNWVGGCVATKRKYTDSGLLFTCLLLNLPDDDVKEGGGGMRKWICKLGKYLVMRLRRGTADSFLMIRDYEEVYWTLAHRPSPWTPTPLMDLSSGWRGDFWNGGVFVDWIQEKDIYGDEMMNGFIRG